MGPGLVWLAVIVATGSWGQELVKHRSVWVEQGLLKDCLYMNIFAPWSAGDEGRRYPILVWVHGGSFLAGSGDTTVDTEATIRNLVFKGIVVVTVNYRLGPLGFLVHRKADGGWSGNYGLWDLVMVLHWLRKNGRQFNGDAEAVTMMGESAGAAAVSALALSPLTTGLLHGAIVMSGSSSAGWAVYRGPEEPAWAAHNVAKYLRCEKHFNQEELNSVLKDFKMDTIPGGTCNLFRDKFRCDYVENDEDLMSCMRGQLNFTNLPFKKALTVELGHTKMVVDGELIPESIESLLLNSSKIPILTGTAADEWAHKKAAFYQIKGYRQWNETAVKAKFTSVALEKWKLGLAARLPNTTYDLVANATFRRYIGATKANSSMDTLALVNKLHEVEADLEFQAPLMREVKAYAEQRERSARVWLYRFEHVPKTALLEDDVRKLDFFGTKQEIRYTRDVRFKEAFHGLDHAYIFTNGIGVNFKFNYTKREKRMTSLLTTLFANFVKYKNPTPAGGVKGLVWPDYRPEEPAFLRIRLPPSVEDGLDPSWQAERYWNQYVPYLSGFATVGDLTAGRYSPLTDRERVELGAYKRAWWALWLLVAAIALLLWTLVLCLVARKCLSAAPDKPLNHLILTSNR